MDYVENEIGNRSVSGAFRYRFSGFAGHWFCYVIVCGLACCVSYYFNTRPEDRGPTHVGSTIKERQEQNLP